MICGLPPKPRHLSYEIRRAAESFDRPSSIEPIFASVPKDVLQEMDRAGISRKDREKWAVLCDMLLRQRKNLRHPNGKRVRLEDAGSIGVRLNAQILRRVFAIASGGPLHELKSRGLVKKVSGYLPGVHSTSYWFSVTLDLRTRQQVEICDSGLRKRLRTWRSDRICRNLKGLSPCYARQLVDLTRVTLPSGSLLRLGALIRAKGKHVGSLRVIHDRFAQGVGGWFTIQPNGRLSTHVTGCPAEVRTALLLDGEPMVEWDIPSSHPALILSQFSTSERHSEEFRILVRLFQTSMFYEAFHAYWEMAPDDVKSPKVLVQKIINDQRPARDDLPLFREMRKELPIFMGKIASLKSSNPFRGQVSNIIQGWEASLVHDAVTILHSEGIHCFTCFDSVGVRLSDAIRARDVLNNEIERTLGFRLCVKTKSPWISGPFGNVPLPGSIYPTPCDIAA